MPTMDNCIFCDHSKFPEPYQLVSDDPNYWYLVHNLKPHCAFHCMAVLKPSAFDGSPHCATIGDVELSQELLAELGVLLNRASLAIRKCEPQIERIFVASLGAGSGTQHLHFHLIPQFKGEQVRAPHDPGSSHGGGLFFLARKELVGDGADAFLKSTTGSQSDDVIGKILTARMAAVEQNALRLREVFEWPGLR